MNLDADCIEFLDELARRRGVPRAVLGKQLLLKGLIVEASDAESWRHLKAAFES